MWRYLKDQRRDFRYPRSARSITLRTKVWSRRLHHGHEKLNGFCWLLKSEKVKNWLHRVVTPAQDGSYRPCFFHGRAVFILAAKVATKLFVVESLEMEKLGCESLDIKDCVAKVWTGQILVAKVCIC